VFGTTFSPAFITDLRVVMAILRAVAVRAVAVRADPGTKPARAEPEPARMDSPRKSE
jgi:hypothetical protein